MANDLAKFGQNTKPMAANTNPMAGVAKPNVSQTQKALKKPVMPAQAATPAVPADPTSGLAATPAVPSPYSKPLVTGQPPSMTNIAANPRATGQATQSEVAGLSLEQWRNVQRMLGMAPSV